MRVRSVGLQEQQGEEFVDFHGQEDPCAMLESKGKG
jgi:hypothetical protein